MKAAASDSTVRQLTVRLSPRLYARTQRAAKTRQLSVSDLVRQLLEDLDKREQEKELERAYNLLGDDAGSDVEPFFEAQVEVVRRG
jgi:hypothetical protein